MTDLIPVTEIFGWYYLKSRGTGLLCHGNMMLGPGVMPGETIFIIKPNNDNRELKVVGIEFLNTDGPLNFAIWVEGAQENLELGDWIYRNGVPEGLELIN